MKTAISIPDHIFQAAETYADDHGVSRSKLYSEAITQFLEKHSKAEVTKKLNEVYSNQTSSIDSSIAALQFNSICEEKW
ncbi:MAG: hypothetical protein CSB24_06585 [Deltaproteobacteria bacterium]|nr:MAG: hypothetical protein CSB24_06585 [Deltaproteobacteria bacterium]